MTPATASMAPCYFHHGTLLLPPWHPATATMTPCYCHDDTLLLPRSCPTLMFNPIDVAANKTNMCPSFEICVIWSDAYAWSGTPFPLTSWTLDPEYYM